MKKLIALALCSMALFGCTDATQSQLSSYGSPHKVICYNYSTVIYDGVSTGRVKDDADSVVFEDRATMKLVEIKLGQSSSCVVRVE